MWVCHFEAISAQGARPAGVRKFVWAHCVRRDAMAGTEEHQKRRRIRGKTRVGNLSVRVPAAEAATAAAAADDGRWSEAF